MDRSGSFVWFRDAGDYFVSMTAIDLTAWL